jgi:hypothetical protein
VDLEVLDPISVGDYISGGAVKVTGSYIVYQDGAVEQHWYPN